MRRTILSVIVALLAFTRAEAASTTAGLFGEQGVKSLAAKLEALGDVRPVIGEARHRGDPQIHHRPLSSGTSFHPLKCGITSFANSRSSLIC